jgi:drug/metabolite transporter (DMT)-like permease
MPFTGEAVCLLTALFWAVAITMFRGPVVRHGARTVSLVKCTLAAALQGLTVLALGQGPALAAAPGKALLALVASGWIGVTIGDTALFAAVARIGVHRTLLLQTLAPVFTALIALAWQGERPTTQQIVGALVILTGVALVVAPDRKGWKRPVERGAVAGVGLGLLAALGQGSGLVLAKVGMETLDAIPASFVRLAAAVVGLVLITGSRRRMARVGLLVAGPDMLSRIVPATLLGAYLALFTMMIGIKLAPAAIAATLLSVSPVYGLFIDAVVHRQAVTLRGLAGTMLAVVGVGLLAYG